MLNDFKQLNLQKKKEFDQLLSQLDNTQQFIVKNSINSLEGHNLFLTNQLNLSKTKNAADHEKIVINIFFYLNECDVN